MIKLIKKIFSKKDKNSIPRESAFCHTSFVPIVVDDSYGHPPTSGYTDFSGGFSSGSHADSGSYSHSDGGSSSDGGSCGCDGGGGGAYFFAQNSVAQVKDVANAQVASLAQAVSTGIIVLNKDKEVLTHAKAELAKEVVNLKEQNNELLANNLRPNFGDVMGSGMPAAPIKTTIDVPLFFPSVPQQ